MNIKTLKTSLSEGFGLIKNSPHANEIILAAAIVAVLVIGWMVSATVAGIATWRHNQKIAQIEAAVVENEKMAAAAKVAAEAVLHKVESRKTEIDAREPRIEELENEITKSKTKTQTAYRDRSRVAAAGSRGDVKLSDLNRRLGDITDRRSHDGP